MKIGVSKRLDGNGSLHPYLVVIEGGDKVFQCTIAMPDDRKYFQEPVHPVYGNLLEGSSPDEVKAAIKRVCEGKKVFTHTDNRGLSLLDNIDVTYVEAQLFDEAEEAFEQIRKI